MKSRKTYAFLWQTALVLNLLAGGLPSQAQNSANGRLNLLILVGAPQVRKQDPPEISLHHFYGGEKVTFNMDVKNMGLLPASGTATVTISTYTSQRLQGQLIQIIRQDVRINSAPGQTQTFPITGTVPMRDRTGDLGLYIAHVQPATP